MLSLNDWIGVADGVLSLVGFSIAFFQLHRIGSNAAAAAAAVQRQLRQTAGAMLSTRVAELERIETELASAGAHRELAKRAVHGWHRTASDLPVILGSLKLDDLTFANTFGAALELSLGLVETTLIDLDDASISVPDACRHLLPKISATCSASRRLTTAMMMAPTDDR